ncbi:hypothetical protein [Bremerella alba]|uniref:Uncharacterized protein n=1 Tax=Bremerella alba TaxID=980252 RepID=A0A7V8V1R4_9BACT|nr:hypothetical protein [Bremerella alba]MBA2113281.1 hypothetical protein [Bremerella alba]
MPSYDLFEAWFRVADWCAYTLAKEGCESIVLKPLGEHSRAAALIAREAAESENSIHRKLAACLAGWIREPEPQLLQDLFQRETACDAAREVNDFNRLDSQSVVEDLMVSAHRWMRTEMLRSPASQTLKQIVRSTMDGHYWNSASEAMIALYKYDPQDSAELLREFAEYANGPAPNHPSRPSLKQEKSAAEKLLRGEEEILTPFDQILRAQDAAAETEIDANSRAAIEHLLAMATDVSS